MCDTENFDIDSLRHQHESPTEWRLRRTFLLAHKDSLPLPSLLCMASCFINIELSGCTYPPAVMERVRTLAEAIRDDVESHRKEVKARTEVKFVKAAADPSQPGTSKSGSGPDEPSRQSHNARGTKRAGLGSSHSASVSRAGSSSISFVKSDDGLSSTNPPPSGPPKKAKKEEPPIDAKFLKCRTLVKELMAKQAAADGMSLLHMATTKLKITLNTRFSTRIDGLKNAEILLDFVLVGEANSTNKKLAKREAAENAVSLLCKKHLRIVSLETDTFKLEGSDTPFDFNDGPKKVEQLARGEHGLQKSWGSASTNQADCYIDEDNTVVKTPDCYADEQESDACNVNVHQRDFFLYEHESDVFNAINILQNTSSVSKIPVQYEVWKGGPGVICKLTFGQIYTGRGEGTTEKEARKDAAEKARDRLRKAYYTIQVKRCQYNEEDGVSVGDKKGEDSAIPESNIGSKLLKMMGWAGGGVGKEGQGIAEPVSVDGVINREGLGLGSASGLTPEFKKKVQQMLEDYMRYGDQKDLVFTSDLSNEERKIIHQMGRKFGLKTKSQNRSKDERYLIVSKKVGWMEIFHTLMKSGGENDKYRLIAPGQHERDEAIVVLPDDSVISLE